MQDPVARSVSAYRMVQRTVCPPSRPELAANCSLPAFPEVVETETTAAGSGLPPQCLFNSQVRRNTFGLQKFSGVQAGRCTLSDGLS